MTTNLLLSSVLVLAGMLATGAAGILRWSIMIRGKRREDLYDRLYSLPWDGMTTNNYGFAPAETGDRERFQLQLYAELSKLLESTGGATGIDKSSRSAAAAAAGSITWR